MMLWVVMKLELSSNRVIGIQNSHGQNPLPVLKILASRISSVWEHLLAPR
jgi:hypothetical protein